MKITYKEIWDSLKEFAEAHRYMTDYDRYGEIDIYDWNKKEYHIEDNLIKPDEQEVYQDCETFSIRCILGLIDVYDDSIKSNLKLMIGKWNGVGHSFFTFIATDIDGIEREFLWDNNLSCPIPLDTALVMGSYSIKHIYAMDSKQFYTFEEDEVLKQIGHYQGVDIDDIIKMRDTRKVLG